MLSGLNQRVGKLRFDIKDLSFVFLLGPDHRIGSHGEGHGPGTLGLMKTASYTLTTHHPAVRMGSRRGAGQKEVQVVSTL